MVMRRFRWSTNGAVRTLFSQLQTERDLPVLRRQTRRCLCAFLKDELLEDVGHCLWTFTLPKMLRPYFVRQRELLGDLARLAYETIKELMLEAVGDPHARPHSLIYIDT